MIDGAWWQAGRQASKQVSVCVNAGAFQLPDCNPAWGDLEALWVGV